MLEIKNKQINKLKLISLSYAVSEKNSKHYCILEIDALQKEQQKQFIEVADEAEFKKICQSVKEQLQ